MNRTDFLRIAGVGGAATATGCTAALDNLDTSAGAEGTGIQFTGLIKVLAKYQATPKQKEVAQVRAGTAYVNKALKPAYQKRRRKIETEQKKKVSAVQKKRAPAPEKEALLAEVQKETDARLIAVDAAWYKQATIITRSKIEAPPSLSMPTEGTVAFASVQTESSQLLADAASYVPQTLAVSVPRANVAAESSSTDSVMFWDTRNRQLAKSEVYVIDRAPKLGQVAKFDDVSAQYAGTGQ